MDAYLDELDRLGADERRSLDLWHALRLAERPTGVTPAPEDEVALETLRSLQAAGEVERRTVRHRVFWRREAWFLTADGRRKLDDKRAEVLRLHGEVGGALATAKEALAARGVDRGVLLLELMILCHGRFDEVRCGFFSRCSGLASFVRGLAATESADDELDPLLAVKLLG